ncbi:MAG: 23S rRNA (uracil(1939)-C(5))-methyltransferase RlmD, partial [Candidatus Izimaplasma sp.]|nr:23S rRNA (uracil(1939)-C(5))-methyltransferase RlmD [Candidatus Izimaplasma bacterium]
MEPLLEVNQEVLITIKRLGINGEGIGFYKRQAVFVDGVFPPEQVVVRITEVQKSYTKAEVVRIKVKAAKRVKPFCKHYDTCGGCQIQHIDYQEQLFLKEEMLIQAFDRYTNLDINTIKFNSMIGMNNTKHYRSKAQMPVENTKYGLTTGLYEKESNKLVPIVDCPIQDDNINRVNQRILEICDKFEIYAFDPLTMRGLVRYVVVRTSNFNDELQVTLVITIFNKALKEAAKEIIQIPGVVSVGISKNRDVKNIEIFGNEVEILEGKDSITEGIGDIRYHLKAKSFYQLNPQQAIKLYAEVKKHLDFSVDKVIVDAYSGSGAISMYLAPYAKKIVGIDISKESTYSARHNMKLNKFNNLTFELGEVKDVLSDYYNTGFNPDVIIFDPPRSGLDPKTIDLLVRKPVKKIIYISCNPSTLTKNIKVLSKKYKVESVTPLDMFPHTSHIES